MEKRGKLLKGLKRFFIMALCLCVMISVGNNGLFVEKANAATGVGIKTKQATKDAMWDATGYYDDSDENYVGLSGMGFGIQRAAIQFNLSDIDQNIKSAKLKIFITNISDRNPNPQTKPYVTVYGMNTDAWQEDSLLIDPADQLIIAKDSNIAASSWKEIDVTNFVKQQMGNDRIISLAMLGNEESADKEFSYASYIFPQASYRPQLVLETETSDSTSPNLQNGTIQADNIGTSEVTLNWMGANDDTTDSSELDYRVYQSTSSNFNTVSEIESGTPLGSGFAKNLTTFHATGLSSNTTYYFNVIVKDAAGNKSAYKMQQVKTKSAAPEVSTSPTAITNITVSNISSTNATVGGDVTSDGNSPIIERGIVFSTNNSYPTIEQHTKISASGTTGLFTVNLTSLRGYTTYYYRVYATNLNGTSYGMTNFFNTQNNDANIYKLALSTGVINDFHYSILNYTVNVPSNTESMTVTPTEIGERATITVNDQSANQVVNLNVGKNTIKIKVTAEDSAVTKTYTITVYRILPAPNVTADDENNQMIGISNLLEYKIDESPWLRYNPLNPPDLSGNKTVHVRIPGNPFEGIPAGEETVLYFTENLRNANVPEVTNATTEEDNLSSSGLKITPHEEDSNVTHFKISDIIGGSLYQNDGTTPIQNGTFITKSEGDTGLKFKPASDANSPAGGIFSFKVQASLNDTGLSLSDKATATISVSEVNDEPEATDDSLLPIMENAPESSIPIAALLANDSAGPNESGQTLTITNIRNTTGGTVRIDGENVIFTPELNYRGLASFEYTIQDNGTTNASPDPRTSVGLVSFIVEARADQPTVTDAVTNEDQQTTNGLVITPTAAGGALTNYFKITGIIGGILYQNDGTIMIRDGDFITVSEGLEGLKFTPFPDGYGTTGFGFIVQAAPGTDGTKLSDGVETSIIVREVNDSPIAEDDTLFYFEAGSPITISFEDLLKNDMPGPANEDCQTLTVKSVENAVGGTVEIRERNIIFTPNKIGAVSFDYTVEDNGHTDSVNEYQTDQAKVNFNIVDTKSPIITLTGENTIYLKKGEAYEEPGFMAFDEVDEDRTSMVTVTGAVNTNQVGTYQLKYNVSDLSGNAAAEVTRTIYVVSADLNTLAVSSGDLNPSFDPQQLNYSLNVPYSMTNIDITANTLDSTASIVINGHAIGNSGTQSVSLVEGSNSISIVVTAQGGSTKSYSLQVNRGFIPPEQPQVSADDIQNVIIGANSTMEYSTDNGNTWTIHNSTNVPAFPGNVTVLVRVKANGNKPAGETATVTFTKNPAPSSNNDETTTSPTTEQIVVDVDGENGTNLTKTPIKRTTEPNGTVKDLVAMSESIAKDTVEKAKQQGVDTARIVIPDTNDKVSEITVEIPKSALKQLNDGKMKLEIATDNAIIAIPTESISTFNDDLYFRVVPLKTKEQQKQVEERAKKEEMIQEIAKNQYVQVLGRPMEIETNMQSREVSIILPLKDSLPADAKEREEVLDNLAIFIEHSDGTKEVLQGKVTSYKKNGELGIEFTVNKFSTFTIVYMDGAQAFFDGKETCGKDALSADTIGCVRAEKSVPVYELVNNRLKKVDTLNAGLSVPAYEAISPMLGLGGDIWVERTNAIRYETPSKAMLAKNAGSKRVKQMWKGLELRPGQIGKVTVLQDTVVWGKINKTKKLPRILKKGEQYRVYRYVPGMYDLGNGKYAVQDENITLQ